jgi:hypothetical protein
MYKCNGLSNWPARRGKAARVFLVDNEIESEEDEIDTDIFTISRLCGDLMEEMMDDNNVDLDGVLVDVSIKVAKGKKKKKLLNKNSIAKKKIVF